MIAPIAGIVGGLIVVLAAMGKNKAGFEASLGSSLAVVSKLTAGFALFQFLMPSSVQPVTSMTTMGCSFK